MKLLYFISAFDLSIIFTYFCIKIAKKFKLMDVPNERKIHKKPVPYLGGVAIYFSFIIVFLFALKISPVFNLKENIVGFIVGSFIIFLFGVYDDIKGSNAFLKFFMQIIVALILIKFGYIINRITNPFGDSIYFPYWVSIIITVLWIVGVINAVNLLDGLDGLAGGVIVISSIFLFIVANFVGNSDISIMTLILIGSVAGFLLYNFPPARIFMGDAGSMFLGFMMAILSIIGNRKSAVAITLLIPIVLLFIPLLDTMMAIFRRIRNKKNIFQADKEHIHHRLMALGIGYRKVLIIIYIVNVYLGLVALLSLFFRKEFIFILFIILLVGVLVLLEVLRFVEKKK